MRIQHTIWLPANDYYTEQVGFKCNGTPIVDLWDTNKPATGQIWS